MRLKIPMAPIRGSAPGAGKAGVCPDTKNCLPVPLGIQAIRPVLLRARGHQPPGDSPRGSTVMIRKAVLTSFVFWFRYSVPLLATSLDNLPPPSVRALSQGTCVTQSTALGPVSGPPRSQPAPRKDICAPFTKTCRMASGLGLMPGLGPSGNQC